MKIIAFIFITAGCGLFLFVLLTIFKENSGPISPIPEQNGVKVIFITPSKE